MATGPLIAIRRELSPESYRYLQSLRPLVEGQFPPGTMRWAGRIFIDVITRYEWQRLLKLGGSLASGRPLEIREKLNNGLLSQEQSINATVKNGGIFCEGDELSAGFSIDPNGLLAQGRKVAAAHLDVLNGPVADYSNWQYDYAPNALVADLPPEVHRQHMTTALKTITPSVLALNAARAYIVSG